MTTLLPSDLSAQEEVSKTLLGNGSGIERKDLGFMVAPSLGLTRMDGAGVALFNVRAGMTVKDRFAMGAFFNTSLNEIKPKSETVPGLYMDHRAFGGFVEYTAFSKKVVHLTFPLYLGYGEVEMDGESGPVGLDEADFLMAEPSVLLEVNLLRHVRFNMGGGYRFVGNTTYRNMDQSDLRGFTAWFGIKVGTFK